MHTLTESSPYPLIFLNGKHQSAIWDSTVGFLTTTQGAQQDLFAWFGATVTGFLSLCCRCHCPQVPVIFLPCLWQCYDSCLEGPNPTKMDSNDSLHKKVETSSTLEANALWEVTTWVFTLLRFSISDVFNEMRCSNFLQCLCPRAKLRIFMIWLNVK